MDNNINKENYFSWEEILREIRKNIKEIIFWGISGLLIVVLIMFFFITPKYTATTDILVSQKIDNNAMQWNAQQTDLQAINTYKDVLKKNIILKPALKELKKNDNYNGNIASLNKAVSVSNQTNSLVVSITAKDKNPYIAADIANTISKVFKQKITKMMHINNITIVSSATPSNKPVSPNIKKGAIIGLLAGILLGIIKVIIMLFFDNTVKSEKYLSNDLELVNLGIIYHMNSDDKEYGVARVTIQNRISSANNDKSNRRV